MRTAGKFEICALNLKLIKTYDVTVSNAFSDRCEG